MNAWHVVVCVRRWRTDIWRTADEWVAESVRRDEEERIRLECSPSGIFYLPLLLSCCSTHVSHVHNGQMHAAELVFYFHLSLLSGVCWKSGTYWFFSWNVLRPMLHCCIRPSTTARVKKWTWLLTNRYSLSNRLGRFTAFSASSTRLPSELERHPRSVMCKFQLTSLSGLWRV